MGGGARAPLSRRMPIERKPGFRVRQGGATTAFRPQQFERVHAGTDEADEREWDGRTRIPVTPHAIESAAVVAPVILTDNSLDEQEGRASPTGKKRGAHRLTPRRMPTSRGRDRPAPDSGSPFRETPASPRSPPPGSTHIYRRSRRPSPAFPSRSANAAGPCRSDCPS